MKRRTCFSALTAALFVLTGVQPEALGKGGGEPAARAQSGKDGSNTSPAARKASDAEKRALDLLLADTLNDPMSAIQYRVSNQVFSCSDALPNPHDQSWNDKSCLCYGVNSRGANNAYQGRRFSVASLQKEKDGTITANEVIIKLDDQRTWAACSAAGWEKRAFTLIHELVN